LVDSEQISADLLDPPCNAVAVERPKQVQRLQDHQRESALLDILLWVHQFSFWLSTEECHVPLGESNRQFIREGGERRLSRG
jgi:hypothetical protein